MLDFRAHLSSFFGEEITDLILEPNKLKIRENVKDLLSINKVHPKKCNECPLSKIDKKMDFPAWLGDLNTTNVHKKEIMLIGISPNNLEAPVHIAYGLSYDYYSEKDIENLNNGAKKFWKMMYYLFDNNYTYLHNNIYITDLAYCDCKSTDSETLKFCSKRRLMDEIEFINPRLIIIHSFISNKIMHIFPKSSIVIPHVQGRGVRYYPFYPEHPEKSHPIWKETKDFIQKYLM